MIAQLVFNGMVVGSVYSIMAFGLVLIYRTLGLINFFHGTMYMLGALLGYKLYDMYAIPIYIVFPLAILGVGLLGALVERVLLRPLSIGIQTRLVIGTVIIGDTIINNLALTVIGPYPVRFTAYTPSNIINAGPMVIRWQQILILAAAAVLGVGLFWFFKNTRLGKSFRALASNPRAARLMGIDISKMRMSTFALASALGAIAGLLAGPMFIVTSTMGDQVLLKAFVVAVLGGLNSLPGAILGGLIIGLVDNLAGFFLGTAFKDMWGFLIMAGMLMFRPNGLFGTTSVEKV